MLARVHMGYASLPRFKLNLNVNHSLHSIFDEGTESADIATNANILLLDEYSKVKLF
jgi:hypothetical protein